MIWICLCFAIPLVGVYIAYKVHRERVHSFRLDVLYRYDTEIFDSLPEFKVMQEDYSCWTDEQFRKKYIK